MVPKVISALDSIPLDLSKLLKRLNLDDLLIYILQKTVLLQHIKTLFGWHGLLDCDGRAVIWLTWDFS